MPATAVSVLMMSPGSWPHCTHTSLHHFLLTCHTCHAAGPAIPDTEIRIVDPSNKTRELPDGQQGIIMANGALVELVCSHTRNWLRV